MTDAPERIWRVKPWTPNQAKHGLASWTTPEEAGEGATEYVRATVKEEANGLIGDLLRLVEQPNAFAQFKDRIIAKAKAHLDLQDEGADE